MKVGTVVLPDAVGPNDLDATAARDAAPGVSWCRFDDTMLYWTSDDERWPAAQRWADTAGLEQHPGPDPAQDLYLVTQVGRVSSKNIATSQSCSTRAATWSSRSSLSVPGGSSLAR